MFLLDWGKKEKRLDPAYYIPSIVELEDMVRARCGNVRLSHYIKQMAGGATPKIEDDTKYSTSENGVPFIRVQNLTSEGVFSLNDVKYISQDTHKHDLGRSAFCDQDLIVKITGVGRMAIASIPPIGFCGNINQHSVRITTGNRGISETLAAYLNLDFVEKLASRRATGGTRPALDYPALRSIPVIFDGRIAKLMANAREQKEKAELEAQQLLDSIDGYLLEKLGITLPKISKNTIKNRKFKRGFFEVSGNRLDPNYYIDYYKDLIRSIDCSTYSGVPLSDITIFIYSGRTPVSKDYSEDITDFPIIKAGSYTGDNIDINKVSYCHIAQPYIVRKNDIFILAAAHQADYVGKHIKILTTNPIVDTSYVGELICIRANEHCNPLYLFSVLSTYMYKTLLNREKRGQTSHIYPRDIKKIRIPLPPINVQNDIAQHIAEIKFKANSLRKEDINTFNETKNKATKLLLKI